ncbi:MAG: carboxypeptidase M32 [Gemmataceae bacterium]
MPTAQEAYEELAHRERERHLLASSAAVLSWDERTYMPSRGAALRADQLALLARLVHERLTDPRVGELLDILQDSDLARGDTPQAANIRAWRHDYRRAVRLPKKLVEELARATTLGQQAWQEARQRADFALFRPHLEKIVRLKREEAQALHEQGSLYDALLDEYEPGMTVEQLTRVLGELRRQLVPLLQHILASRRGCPQILQRHYPVDRQEEIGRQVATAIGFDFSAGRLDRTVHPFCSGIGPGDVRLTTRYHPRHFGQAFFGVLHEAGHGLYEQGLSAEAFGTPIGQACSLGIHESQSRLWENFVGRSRPFWEYFYPAVREAFPEALGTVALDEFLLAVNYVERSLIRVEADEVTYNLHILLRFELEQALLTQDLPVADLPAAWNHILYDLLELRPENDAAGCLQDIHWSAGLFGYFPTYTLGNLYAAQFMEKAHADIPSLKDHIRHGRFEPLLDWLREHIHRHGRRYLPGELCRRITGRELSAEPFLRYLRSKYAELYGLGHA